MAWVKSALWWAWLTSGSFLNSFPHECWASDHFREQQKSLSWVCELDYGVFPVCKLHTCLLLPSHHLLFPLLVPPFFLELEEWSIMLSKVPHFILYFFVFPLFPLSLYCVNSYFISLVLIWLYLRESFWAPLIWLICSQSVFFKPLWNWMILNHENSPHFGDYESITSTYLLDNWVPEANRR